MLSIYLSFRHGKSLCRTCFAESYCVKAQKLLVLELAYWHYGWPCPPLGQSDGRQRIQAFFFISSEKRWRRQKGRGQGTGGRGQGIVISSAARNLWIRGKRFLVASLLEMTRGGSRTAPCTGKVKGQKRLGPIMRSRRLNTRAWPWPPVWPVPSR